MTDTQSYIHNGVEVVRTGRTAKKKLGRTSRTGSEERVDILHEVTPLNNQDGSWKKWVRLGELYEVSDGDEQE